ncbi:hypothetical protein ACO1O0_005614 [Amphichorda felina]
MADQVQELLEAPTEFAKNGIQFMRRCTKPDKSEYLRLCQAVGVGLIIMGSVGYLVKLVYVRCDSRIVDRTNFGYQTHASHARARRRRLSEAIENEQKGDIGDIKMSEQKGRRKHFIFTHFIGFTRTGVVVMYKSGFKNKLGLLDAIAHVPTIGPVIHALRTDRPTTPW